MSKQAIMVYGFMINPHEMQVVSDDGKHHMKVQVDSDNQAKEKFMSEVLNQQLISALGYTNFSTIWVDDPAGVQEVIEACRLMEEGDKEEKPETEAEVPEGESEPQNEKPVIGDEVFVHTKENVFQVEVDGEFKDIPGQLLNVDDICRYFPEKKPVNPDKWKVIASPQKVSENSEEEDWIIQLKKIENVGDWSSPDGITWTNQSVPQFDTTGQTKIIEVECAETASEEEIKKLGRKIRSLKLEALQSAADYRDEIKKLEKRFFEMCEGKSYTHMECNVVTDWDAGERKYIRPDTGEIAKIEKISYEEQQMNMKNDLNPDEPEDEWSELLTDETDSPEIETESGENETEEPETDDFPPTEEENTVDKEQEKVIEQH